MYKKESETCYYVSIPADQPNNLFEFKTLSNPPSSESQTETSNSCSNKNFVVKPSEMQSPRLGLFQPDDMDSLGVTPGVHSTISYEQMSNAPEELDALKHREKKDRR